MLLIEIFLLGRNIRCVLVTWQVFPLSTNPNVIFESFLRTHIPRNMTIRRRQRNLTGKLPAGLSLQIWNFGHYGHTAIGIVIPVDMCIWVRTSIMRKGRITREFRITDEMRWDEIFFLSLLAIVLKWINVAVLFMVPRCFLSSGIFGITVMDERIVRHVPINDELRFRQLKGSEEIQRSNGYVLANLIDKRH